MKRNRIMRLRTQDALTYDRATIDSAGAFLVGELERLDPSLHYPMAAYTWSRDINVRNDVSMADEVSSFTNSSFAAPDGRSATGKNWIGKDSNAIQGMQLDIGKTAHPLTLWGMQLGWTLPELASAEKLGRPIDQQKLLGMQRKWQMDIDEQVYVGDASIGATGLLNDPNVTESNAPNGDWSQTTDPDQIIEDVNDLLTRVWEDTGWSQCPGKLLVSPSKMAVLVSAKVSTAGNMSVLNYLKQNSLANSVNGTPLDIQAVKWLDASAPTSGGVHRMIAYTNQQDMVRFPMVPLQRTPLEFRDLRQLVTYYGRLGQVEFVYPNSAGYTSGI